jgi:hypothetical protein
MVLLRGQGEVTNGKLRTMHTSGNGWKLMSIRILNHEHLLQNTKDVWLNSRHGLHELGKDSLRSTPTHSLN